MKEEEKKMVSSLLCLRSFLNIIRHNKMSVKWHLL
jgi:hypothetical protein